MKQGKLLHIGLIIGDFALFFGLEVWVEMLFFAGYGAGLAATVNSPDDIVGLITTLFYSGALFDVEMRYVDIIQLLFYPMVVSGLFAFLIARTKSWSNATQEIRLKRPRYSRLLPLLMPLAIGAFLTVTAVFALIPEDLPLLQEYTTMSELALNTETPFLSFMVAVVCAPFVEEFFFRGLIFNHLRQVFPKRKWLAMLLSAAVFGLAHGQLLWILYATLLGIIFAMVYDYFDSLPTSIFLHLLFNFSNYLPWPEAMFESTYSLLIVLFASLLVLSLILLLMVLTKRRDSTSLKAGL